MNSNQIAAYKNLEQAQQALKSGDKETARQQAAQAAQIAPELEEVWLLMAALATPRESVQYLEKALNINPASERAQKGMNWAQGRLKKEDEAAATLAATREPIESLEPVAISSAQHEPDVADQDNKADEAPLESNESDLKPEPTEPYITDQTSETVPVAVPVVESKDAAARPRTSLLAVLIVLLCLILAWLGWQGINPAIAFITSNVFNSQDSGPGWAEAHIAKAETGVNQPLLAVTPMATSGVSSGLSTLTPTPEMNETSVPTATIAVPTETAPIPTEVPASATPLPTDSLPAPTATVFDVSATPLPTDTQPAAPSATVEISTATLAPSLTPLPTDIMSASATPQLQEGSPTPLPTDTAEPGPTKIIVPTPKAGDSGNSGRWIDVDLTNQRVYAYEGNTVVNSFIVSTGTWQYPTVTGQYKVYVKYRYTDMSGPGYYLANVPFTMYFYQGYAIHGTYWHNNFGTPMSHGCVNFSIPDAEWIYNFSSVGTLVNVHY